MIATDPKPKRRSAISLWGLIEVGSVILCVATVTGFLGRVWWILELTSHFKFQLAVLLLCMAAIWLIRKRWWMAGACVVFGLMNAVLVISQFIPNGELPINTGPSVKLTGVNVHTANQESHRLVQFLKETKPDIVLLMEVNQRWMSDLEQLRSIYPAQLSSPREDNFGIALFSQLPLTNSAVIQLGEAGVPSLSTDVLVDGSTFHLLGTHPLPPGSSEYSRLRNEQLVQIAQHAAEQPLPTVVLGDLNSTPWSPYFKSLMKKGNLKNSSKGRGIMGSWPAGLPLMRIPLDHCLVSPSIEVNSRSLGPSVGSDHLPVMVELILPETNTIQ